MTYTQLPPHATARILSSTPGGSPDRVEATLCTYGPNVADRQERTITGRLYGLPHLGTSFLDHGFAGCTTAEMDAILSAVYRAECLSRPD